MDKSIPHPPPGPPCRIMKETFFAGLIETKESKQRRRDYEMFMAGWSYANGKSGEKPYER